MVRPSWIGVSLGVAEGNVVAVACLFGSEAEESAVVSGVGPGFSPEVCCSHPSHISGWGTMLA